jgi:hypothetical protein
MAQQSHRIYVAISFFTTFDFWLSCARSPTETRPAVNRSTASVACRGGVVAPEPRR